MRTGGRMRKKVFLSYRRDDSSGYTQRLHDELSRHYGPTAVFIDVHKIRPLDRFKDVIDHAIKETGILFVVMSKQWSSIANTQGSRRILDPDDIVCSEILGAFVNSVPVLPVLVGGASMPLKTELPESIQALVDITAHVMSDVQWNRDFEELVRLIDQRASVVVPVEMNPFSIRAGITDDRFFHDRNRERRMLRDYIQHRQNCQLVGERRIGKSSLLRYVERHACDWAPGSRVAYLDLQDPRCYTLSGWLKEIGEGLRLQSIPENLVDLAEGIEDLMAAVQPILCLDEFGEMTRRPAEFTREVFLTLRSFGQRGMSIVTASTKRLSELTNPQDSSSPFFNTFPVLPVKRFTNVDARAYVEQSRADVPEFTETERERILEFAGGHPLALQCACYHVLNGRESQDDLGTALKLAREDFSEFGPLLLDR
jgi:hypothetical protein